MTSSTQSAPESLERHFLELRCRMLDLAAAFDRLSRAPGGDQLADDPRMKQLQQGLKIVASEGPDRAERFQLLFSDEYDPQWTS